MVAYASRRLIGIIPGVLLLLLLVVILVRLIPGNTVDAMLGDFRASKVDRSQLEQRLGISDPIPVQYAHSVADLLRGDLGKSLWDRKPVWDLVYDKLPVTLELALMAGLLGGISGIALGVISGVRQDSFLDFGLRCVSVFFLSVPNFVLASAAVIVPAIYFGWSPPLIYHRLSQDPLANLKQIFLPAVLLGLPMSAALMRLTRSAIIEVWRQDYMRTARAKGLSTRSLLMRHALRNALVPVLSLLGLQVALLISGSVIIESIFSIPGIGSLVIGSLRERDYPVIEGVTVVLGVLVMLTNLLVDLSYVLIDPRIRLTA